MSVLLSVARKLSCTPRLIRILTIHCKLKRDRAGEGVIGLARYVEQCRIEDVRIKVAVRRVHKLCSGCVEGSAVTKV